MEPAKVYFSDLHTDEISTLEKLRRLMKAAGFEQIDFKDKYVAVKLHFGEPGNMAYLRPNWARVVCDYVRALGGKPFLTDCIAALKATRSMSAAAPTRSTISTAPCSTAIRP